MQTKEMPSCALCPYDWSERYCRGPGGKAPENCPSLLRDLAREAQTLISAPELLDFPETVRSRKPRLTAVVNWAMNIFIR